MRGSRTEFNKGTRTVHQSSFADYRRQLLQANMDQEAYQNAMNNTEAMSQGIYDMERAKTANQQNQNLANYLMTLSQSVAGRGVNKSIESPAELQGMRPQNPQFFGLGRKDAIPYQKALADGQNLRAVLSGYSELRPEDGQMSADAANVIATASRRAGLVSEAFNKPQRDSIYAGVPKNAAVNLFEIKLRNKRRDSIYALY